MTQAGSHPNPFPFSKGEAKRLALFLFAQIWKPRLLGDEVQISFSRSLGGYSPSKTARNLTFHLDK